MDNPDNYQNPTYLVDSDAELIRKKAENLVKDPNNKNKSAINLFYFVRDRIKYNPYNIVLDIESFKATVTLQRGYGFCVSKAILLAALARSIGLPTRVRFADIINHQLPEKLLDLIKDHTIYYHGFCEFFLGGKWVVVTPAFDREMCEETGLRTVEFDGKNSAVFHKKDLKGRPHINYLKYHKPSDLLPLAGIRRRYRGAYNYEVAREGEESDEQSYLRI